LQSAQLSSSLLPAALKEPAKQLYFIMDRSLAELPLAMLRWPNTEGWLIEHSSVSRLVSLNAPEPTQSRPSKTGPIDAFVAAIISNEQLKLPPLASAEYEPEWIQSALPGATVKAIRGPQFDRNALLQSLRRSGQWVHVAAHGSVPSGLNGFAGLWLNDEHNQPQYLSWIDLVGEPLAAELAVFNACEIGASASAVSKGNQGFARMLSSAGVRHLVAASWPISDAAAGIWVPTFYQTLAPPNGSENTALALQKAQLSLLNSRRFRHPYWWAGLIHYARELPSQ
jgi:CHAT domain-containing protein